MEYDDVMNKHRGKIYKIRKDILAASDAEISQMAETKIKDLIGKEDLDKYKEKEKKVGESEMRNLERFIMLNTLDMFWTFHFDNMSHLRESVGLRAYGQRDPLVEYKNESHGLFKKLLEDINFATADTLLRAEFRQAPASQKAGLSTGTSAKVGRNDPCPCGSGKKYKHCHGKV